ncbi:MAG: UbiA family prenyltransferase, partial [Rhodobiaceae bacterium]|nr:UbiA family prenyltransferase [Rhodobiaceae bacterium]
IIFLWTPPHFWSLALLKQADYERVGIPMLPVVKGEAVTRTQILAYSLPMAVTGALPYALGFAGLAYGIVSILAGLAFLGLALRVYRTREGKAARKACRDLFAFSILYLFGLFAMLLAEYGLGVSMGPLLAGGSL